jgi:hypothetical protein
MERAADRPHSKFRHVYPIVRIDTPFDQNYPMNTVTVVKVWGRSSLLNRKYGA